MLSAFNQFKDMARANLQNILKKIQGVLVVQPFREQVLAGSLVEQQHAPVAISHQ
jgi:hypothetical protein